MITIIAYYSILFKEEKFKDYNFIGILNIYSNSKNSNFTLRIKENLSVNF